jgi:O-methyltransferase
LKTIRRILRRVVHTVPCAQALRARVNNAVGKGPRPEFSGWGMVTAAAPPWHDGGGDDLARDFVKVNAEITARVATGELRLSQFDGVQDKQSPLRELMWRHFVVFWSARYALEATASPVKNLVECGVCDGLTACFAMSAVQGRAPFKAYLYDAWEGMKAEYLLESEQSAAGAYSYLSFENTQRNLAAFKADAIFIKGFVPESFETAATPADIAWLHIDLNSALPTAAALKALFDKMSSGSLILFDDYGWRPWRDTKVAVDAFLAGKRGVLLPMPTGQAVFFKL